MTDEQIKRLLERTRRRFCIRTWTLPALTWMMTVGTSLALVGADMAALAIVFGSCLALPSFTVSREASSRWREFNRAPAQRLWKELSELGALSPSSQLGTFPLDEALRSLYVEDPRGEVLPIARAARLIVVYDAQQQRRSTILGRSRELNQVREQLMEKAARLQSLGDTSLAVPSSIREMAREIETLERIADDLAASCHRLETLVLEVHRAVQIKQLHREIAELKSSVSPETTASAELVAPTFADLERQIAREIETFLLLERETDAHLREL